MLPSLLKSADSFGLDSTPTACGVSQFSSNWPEPSARFRNDAHVGTHLVDGHQVDEAVVVEIAGHRAVDARLRAAIVR
jgi:hypothetical protein